MFEQLRDGGFAAAAERECDLPEEAAVRRSMEMAAVSAHAGGSAFPRMPALLSVMVGLALIAGLAVRTLVGWDRPLWSDEVFTGAIALQPHFSVLIQDTLNELGGPLYYWTMWLWVKIVPATNLGLRLPAGILSVAAPALLLWKGHPDRNVRMVWAALAALLLPVISYSNDARSYSLLFFLACTQLILFRKLLREPRTGNAALWALVSGLMILTHLYAAVIGLVQGLLYLAIHRERALKTWPAALVFLPMAGWLAVHLPLYVAFSDPHIAWHSRLTGWEMLGLPAILLELGLTSHLLLLCVGGTMIWQVRQHVRGRAAFPHSREDVAAFGSAIIAIAALAALGMATKSFTPRYMIPFLPGLVFAIALWATDLARRYPLIPVAVIGTFLIPVSLQLASGAHGGNQRSNYTYQPIAEDLMAADVRRVVYLFDDPLATDVGTLMARVASFFYDRVQAPVDSETLVLNPYTTDVDPYLALKAALDRRPPQSGRSAFVWTFIRNDRGRSLESRYPLRMAEVSREFTCRNYSVDNWRVMLACVRRTPPAPPTP